MNSIFTSEDMVFKKRKQRNIDERPALIVDGTMGPKKQASKQIFFSYLIFSFSLSLPFLRLLWLSEFIFR